MAAINKRVLLVLLMLVMSLSFSTGLSAGNVPNGSLNARGGMSEEKIAQLRENGWICPDAKHWPSRWDGQGDKMKIEWFRTGGKTGDGYGRISGGKTGYVNGYWGKFFKASQILTFQARGKGTIRVGLMAYKFSDDHKEILPGGGIPGFDIKVNSDVWEGFLYDRQKIYKP